MGCAIAQPACGPEEIGHERRVGWTHWRFCASFLVIFVRLWYQTAVINFLRPRMRLFIHGPFTSEALALVVARSANTKLPETNG
jgi:hypothetical protein